LDSPHGQDPAAGQGALGRAAGSLPGPKNLRGVSLLNTRQVMRIDLHCHTRYSRDSLTTFDALLRAMDARKLDMVAITDHNTIAGAIEFRTRAPARFVIGAEIKTLEGELLALFLEEQILPGLSLAETIACIRDQGAQGSDRTGAIGNHSPQPGLYRDIQRPNYLFRR
jgi:hypothetical protein